MEVKACISGLDGPSIEGFSSPKALEPVGFSWWTKDRGLLKLGRDFFLVRDYHVESDVLPLSR